VAFFRGSGKRNFVLKSTVGRQLQSLCETRWVERHDAILLFCSELDNIVESLHVVSQWSDRESASKANALMHAICCSEFIASIYSLTDVLSLTLPISKKLQQVKTEFTDAAAMVNDAVSVLEKRRLDFQHFDSVFESACGVMERLNVPVSVPRTTARQTKRANMPGATPAEYYRRAVYLPLLDCIISDFHSRFQDNILNILTELVFFIPSHIVLTDGEDCVGVDSFLAKYSDCLPGPVDKFVLRGEVDLWRQKWLRTRTANPDEAVSNTAIAGLLACDRQTFRLIHSFLTILLTLPVSTAGVERSFSTLRRAKTWLRSRMGEERLTGLALLNIHRDIPVDTDSVIDRFANSKKRYLDFVI